MPTSGWDLSRSKSDSEPEPDPEAEPECITVSVPVPLRQILPVPAVLVPVPVPQHWRLGSGNKLDVSQVLAGQEKARLLGLDQTVDVSSLKFYYAEDDGGFPLGMTSERMPNCFVFVWEALFVYFFAG